MQKKVRKKKKKKEKVEIFSVIIWAEKAESVRIFLLRKPFITTISHHLFTRVTQRKEYPFSEIFYGLP